MSVRRLVIRLACLCLAALSCPSTLARTQEDYAAQRAKLIRTIAAEARETKDYLDKDTLDPRVLAAMGRVPRHALVPEEERERAYLNRPLPIGHGQTISQPYIVAVMTDLLQTHPGDRVLEIGTGSGYQAAVLAELVDQVYTMEIIEALGERARRDLQALGYHNVHVQVADGYYGWPEQAPFDAIIVTAAAGQIPPPLLRQLRPGGRMVIPVGTPFAVQQLVVVEKHADGEITTRQVLPVSFVPLTGDH